MKKFLAAALASMMLIGGAALALADGELNICSPNSDGLLSIIPVFEEQTGIKVKVESIGTGDCMKRIGSEIAQEYSTFDLMYGGSLANYVANADLFQDYVSDQDQYLMDAYKNTRGYCTNYTIDGSVLLGERLRRSAPARAGGQDRFRRSGFFFLRVLPAHQHAARHGRL